jgi:hypothetical protein
MVTVILKHYPVLFFLLLSVNTGIIFAAEGNTTLWNEGLAVIPYPRSVILKGTNFVFNDQVCIRTDKSNSPGEEFAAEELSRQLFDDWGITTRICSKPGKNGILLTCRNIGRDLGNEGYSISSSSDGVIVNAHSSAGLFYGVQTLLQLIQKVDDKLIIKGMLIYDRPEISIRAVHYDTKHFQENKEYVRGFIRTLAHYKINMLIWEWEDKFAYGSHPEVGAPGAYTIEEMQEFTRYARKYHIQIVPLIQGLGHASYILKHPENRNLREIESNNWGFCPLREGTYNLMTDLIREAAEATPGSQYIHIGCDETYVVGTGISCGCKEKAEKEGVYALREIYINRISEQVRKLHRIPVAWDGGYDPSEKVKPVKGLFTPGGFDPEMDKAALEKGYPLYIYDPNPGIEHLFLPYFYREGEKGLLPSHLEESYEFLTKTARSGRFKGVISTSWNCSGVHNQIWMLRYLTAAECCWNPDAPDLDEFVNTFFINYYGSGSKNVKELYILLNRASYYYMSTFERKVWHWGEVGKTHLPDLPRDDMEYDPYWNTEYADLINSSGELLPKMERVLAICRENIDNHVKNVYDFELFEALARLFIHTANTCLMLSSLEKSVALAAKFHFDDNRATINELINAVKIIEDNLSERDSVFRDIKRTWEKSQLPKGMSTPGKKYLHARDQQRNFANRRPDLSFMICDEESLGLENYLRDLKEYVDFYKTKYLSD